MALSPVICVLLHRCSHMNFSNSSLMHWSILGNLATNKVVHFKTWTLANVFTQRGFSVVELHQDIAQPHLTMVQRLLDTLHLPADPDTVLLPRPGDVAPPHTHLPLPPLGVVEYLGHRHHRTTASDVLLREKDPGHGHRHQKQEPPEVVLHPPRQPDVVSGARCLRVLKEGPW